MRPDLAPLLEQIVSTRLASPSLADRAAVDLALDALVQLETRVSPDLAMRAFNVRPVQALVLLSHAGSDADETLLTLTRHEQGLTWFAATNLALVRKTIGLASAVLQTLEVSATLTISDDGSFGLGAGTGGGTQGCGVEGIAAGLPPWPSYSMTSIASPGAVVLAPGPTSIYYHRRITPAGRHPAFSTSTVSGPSSHDRLRYIAALVGSGQSTLPLFSHHSYSVRSPALSTIEAEVARIRQDITRRHRLVLARLITIGMLAHDEADAIPLPTITVTVNDLRQGASAPRE